MPKKHKILSVFVFILLAFLFLLIATYVTLSLTGVFDKVKGLSIVFGIITPSLGFVWSFLVIASIRERELFRQLKIDNNYYFNSDFFFFNYQMFEANFKKRIRRYKKKESYFVSFTGCRQEISTNLVRNDIVDKFNFLICQMITIYFTSKGRPVKDVLYCFNRDSFVVHIVAEQAKVNELIREFEAKIYAIAKDNDLRILVQPFFGVSKYDPKKSTTANIENASLARHNSERHFELCTYFDASLQYNWSNDETNEILEAMKKGEFKVYYQPKFNLEKKQFVSSEALIRWDSPVYGLLPPSRFITKAEAAGLIHDLDIYVFNQVCKDLAETKRRGRRLIPVSINFSLYEFYSPNFIKYILDTIDSAKIPRNLIEIEITETTTQANAFLCISVIQKLKDEGIRILMDDFGVGYSNFNNLRKMPIDAIKIDKVFIDDIVTDVKTRHIVAFLINLGKVNGLEVIAEGVDNRQQVEILRRNKLDTIQGFYYSKPIPKKEYDSFLQHNRFEEKGAN